MNGMMDQQTLYLLDENDTILLSGGSQKISEERLPKLEGTSGDTHVENGAWLVRNKKLEEGGMALVSIVPRNVLMQESGKIIREMLIFLYHSLWDFFRAVAAWDQTVSGTYPQVGYYHGSSRSGDNGANFGTGIQR